MGGVVAVYSCADALHGTDWPNQQLFQLSSSCCGALRWHSTTLVNWRWLKSNAACVIALHLHIAQGCVHVLCTLLVVQVSDALSGTSNPWMPEKRPGLSQQASCRIVWPDTLCMALSSTGVCCMWLKHFDSHWRQLHIHLHSVHSVHSAMRVCLTVCCQAPPGLHDQATNPSCQRSRRKSWGYADGMNDWCVGAPICTSTSGSHCMACRCESVKRVSNDGCATMVVQTTVASRSCQLHTANWYVRHIRRVGANLSRYGCRPADWVGVNAAGLDMVCSRAVPEQLGP